MSHARRAQERSINNNQSNEQPLCMQSCNDDLRLIRETNLHEKKDKTKKEDRRRIDERTKFIEKHILHMHLNAQQRCLMRILHENILIGVGAERILTTKSSIRMLLKHLWLRRRLRNLRFLLA